MSTEQGNTHWLALSDFIVRCPGMPFDLIRVYGSSGALTTNLVTRRQLWGMLDNVEIQDAIASLNPGLFQLLLKKRRGFEENQTLNSDARRTERTLYNLLVRICTRNDTTGTAGLTFRGQFEATSEANLIFVSGNRRIENRFIFFSPSYVRQLLKDLDGFFWLTLSHPPSNGVDRIPIRSPAITRTNEGSYIDRRTEKPVHLENEQHQSIFDMCSNGRSVNEILAHVGNNQATRFAFRNMLSARILELEALVTDDNLIVLGPLVSSIRKYYSGSPPCMSLASELEKIELECAQLNSRSITDRAADFTRINERFDSMKLLRWDSIDDLTSRVLRDQTYWTWLTPTIGEHFVAQGQLLQNKRTGVSRELESRTARIISSSDGSTTIEKLASSFAGTRDEFANLIEKLLSAGVLALSNHNNLFTDLVSALSIAPNPSGDLKRLQRLHSGDKYALIAESTASAQGIDKNKKDGAFMIMDASLSVEVCKVGGTLAKKISSTTQDLLRLLAFRTYFNARNSTVYARDVMTNGEVVPLIQLIRRIEAATKVRRDKRRDDKTPSGDSDLSLLWKQTLMESAWVKELDIKHSWDQRDRVLKIQEVQYPMDFFRWLENKTVLGSPDLMLSGLQSNGTLDPGFCIVLNEIHSGSAASPLTTRFSYVYRDRTSSKDPILTMLAANNALIWPMEAGTKIEYGARAELDSLFFLVTDGTRPKDDPKRCVPVGSLYAKLANNNELVLFDEERTYLPVRGALKDTQLTDKLILVGDTEGTVGADMSAILIGPSETGGNVFMPEVRLGDLIICRRQVAISTDRLFPSEMPAQEMSSHACSVLGELGFGRFNFFRFQGQKPVFVDSASEFSLTSVRDLAEKTMSTRVTISAMNPGPDQNWVSHRTGSYCSEIRFSAALISQSMRSNI